MKSRLTTAGIAAAVVLIDRLSKLYIRASFSPFDVVPVIPGFFNIVHTENPGAAFGMFSESQNQWRGSILAGISIGVMAVISVMLWKHRPAGTRAIGLVPVGLSLVLGGAIGNVWDRLFTGTVTDFLQFFFGSYEFPSFNAADSAITVGAALLLLDLWRTRHHVHSPEPPPEERP